MNHILPAVPPRDREAFTLVELLVVVAVLVLLLSLLTPALRLSMESARATKCLANERSIGAAVIMYCREYDDYFPLSSHTTGGLARSASWLQSLQEFGVIKAARFCPSDPFRASRLTSFATNDYFEPLTPGVDYHPVTRRTLPNGRRRALNRLAQIPRPSLTVYAVEPKGEGTVDHIHAVGWTRASQVGSSIAATRHANAANYLFIDGHAGPIGWPHIERTFSAQNNLFNPEAAR